MLRSLFLALTLMLAGAITLGTSPSLAARELDCLSFRTQDAARRAIAVGVVTAAALDTDGDGQVCEDRFGGESSPRSVPPVPAGTAPDQDVDCHDLVHQEVAQRVLEQDPADPYNLDPGGDGVACSLLPSLATSPQGAVEPVRPVVPADKAPADSGRPAAPQSAAPVDPATSAPPRGSRLKTGLVEAGDEVDAFWAATSAEFGWTYARPEIRMFQARMETGCGLVETGVGPLYCPLDQTLYVDMPVIKQIELLQDPFVMRIVFAHEWAHHVQYLSGYDVAIFPDAPGEVLGLQLELHADCLAGVWARSAMEAGKATEDDLLNAMVLAYVLGDPVDTPLLAPDAHGSGEMRLGAFVMGLEHGAPKRCEREILKLL